MSLLESILDFQFEVLTTYLNDGGQLPQRSSMNNAHAYLGAPYGIYSTMNGYIALAMGSVYRLGELLNCPPLMAYTDPASLFSCRDEIKSILALHLQTGTTEHWLEILEAHDVWCSNVLTWRQLFEHEAFKALDMVQSVSRDGGIDMRTTRCPIRIDAEIFKCEKGAPRLGADTEALIREFSLS